MVHKCLHSSAALLVYVHPCSPIQHERYSVYIELERPGLLCRGLNSVFGIRRSQTNHEGLGTAAPYPEGCGGRVLTQCSDAKVENLHVQSFRSVPHYNFLFSVSPNLSIMWLFLELRRGTTTGSDWVMVKEHKYHLHVQILCYSYSTVPYLLHLQVS